MSGKKLKLVEAHGKHLCYHWPGGNLVHIHLGLYGRFRNHDAPLPAPRGKVRLRVAGTRQGFDLNGPNQCELIDPQTWAAIRGRLGPDPLRPDADAERVWQRIHASRAGVGSLLLNQSVISGVGNIYRSEILFLLKLHPELPGCHISREIFDDLWNRLRSLLRIGVRYNRIIVVDPKDIGKPRSKMTQAERLLIYKKSRCGLCNSEVKSWMLAARKVYACPKCQRQ